MLFSGSEDHDLKYPQAGREKLSVVHFFYYINKLTNHESRLNFFG